VGSRERMSLPSPPGLGALAALGGGVAVPVLLVFGGSALLCGGYFGTSQTIAPDEFGVRQVFVGPSKGLDPTRYGPGTHVVIPGYERLHTFPADLQVLDMNDQEVAWLQAGNRLPEDLRVAPSIRIQTSEGYQVTVDVTILFRIVDPYIIATTVGPGRLYETKVVTPQADKILRQTLGRLDAEDFYNDGKRIAAAEEARKLLTEDLKTWGLEVSVVLVRDYTYDTRYQQAIEQRKVQDQTVFKNKAEAAAATQEAEKNRVLAEGRATIEVEKERGRAEVRKLAAEADLHFRQKVAEGDKLVALAEAEGTRLENEALQQAGASNLVGLEMAKALQGTTVIVVSTTGAGAMNPLDLNRMVSGW
jgi:regulator of protease activity HflC (stomatin/prohibitin superfamily)